MKTAATAVAIASASSPPLSIETWMEKKMKETKNAWAITTTEDNSEYTRHHICLC